MTASDAPNCSITYDRNNDNCNSFIIQATGYRDFNILNCVLGVNLMFYQRFKGELS